MTAYIDTETGEYPISEYQIRERSTDTIYSVVNFDPRPRYQPVLDTPVPDHNPLAVSIAPGAPELVDGEYRRTWVVAALPDDQIAQNYDAKLEQYYDTKASERRYANRVTCSLRAGYPGPFQAEGIAFATWMDECNALGYQIIADVKAGKRPLPTFDQLISELPVLVWPS